MNRETTNELKRVVLFENPSKSCDALAMAKDKASPEAAQSLNLSKDDGDAVVLLDALIKRAVAVGASDIHLEPKRDRLQVRFRIDGSLVEQAGFGLDIAPEVVSRIKVLSSMDISERRRPQDGQFTLQGDLPHMVNLRSATFPCTRGEKVVLRLLLGQSLIAFDKLGMTERVRERVRAMVRQPQGFIVTCGPTGSGKTSTLYSFLQLIDTTGMNVVTLEDPIEVELYTVTQGQTNPRAGFTFATGLRATLRQDPDVIFVGEIRDAETAGIALQAALTGHLVMSTLHTSDVVETIVRLVDLGVEPWIIANALSGVLAQRLVRILCPKCCQPGPITADFWDEDELLLPAGTEVMLPKGCANCQYTGYRGRTGLFQMLEMDDELEALIKAKSGPADYRRHLAQLGVPSLRRVGFDKVLAGITTPSEVARVTAG